MYVQYRAAQHWSKRNCGSIAVQFQRGLFDVRDCDQASGMWQQVLQDLVTVPSDDHAGVGALNRSAKSCGVTCGVTYATYTHMDAAPLSVWC